MIKCQICNKQLKQITTTGHLRLHGISLDAYKEKFPSAKVVSDSTRKSHADSIKKKIEAGEHFVPFRDIKGFAQKIHDKYKKKYSYVCIRCGQEREINKYLADRRKFCGSSCQSKYIQEHPELYSDRNRKISQSNKGKTRPGRYSRCRGGYRQDIGHYVRSGWEADVCRIFKYHKKEYAYESFAIVLNDNGQDLYWNIDFIDPECFLSNGYVEVKGWWDDKSKRKLELLKDQYPVIFSKLKIIDVAEMKKLIKQYSNAIINWESKK